MNAIQHNISNARELTRREYQDAFGTLNHYELEAICIYYNIPYFLPRARGISGRIQIWRNDLPPKFSAYLEMHELLGMPYISYDIPPFKI